MPIILTVTTATLKIGISQTSFMISKFYSLLTDCTEDEICWFLSVNDWNIQYFLSLKRAHFGDVFWQLWNLSQFLPFLKFTWHKSVKNCGKYGSKLSYTLKYRKHFVKKSCNECHESQTNHVITDTRSWTNSCGLRVSNSFLLANECLKTEVRVVQVNWQGPWCSGKMK